MCCHHQILSVPHEVCPSIVPVLSAFLSTHVLYYILHYILLNENSKLPETLQIHNTNWDKSVQ